VRDDGVGVCGVWCFCFFSECSGKTLVDLLGYMGGRAKDQRRSVLSVADDVKVAADFQEQASNIAAVFVADILECFAAVVDAFVV